MKQLVRNVIRWVVFHAPWGAREAMLNACIESIGDFGIRARLFNRYRILEVASQGDRGMMSSAWNDHVVLTEYARTGTFSETISAAMVAFFKDEPGTYMDIGANIGLTVIPLARKANVRCLAFEPEPTNFGFLCRNVARNAPDGNVAFIQKALFHEHGTMSLAIAAENLGDHRLTREATTGRQTISIPTVPLDDYLPQVEGKLAIKIDTQGAEPFVVAGGRQVFARAGLVAMEFCPFLMRQLGGDPEVVIDVLSGFDRVAVMSGGVAETPRFIAPNAAQAILREKMKTATDSDGDYLDILAARD